MPGEALCVGDGPPSGRARSALPCFVTSRGAPTVRTPLVATFALRCQARSCTQQNETTRTCSELAMASSTGSRAMLMCYRGAQEVERYWVRGQRYGKQLPNSGGHAY